MGWKEECEVECEVEATEEATEEATAMKRVEEAKVEEQSLRGRLFRWLSSP